MRFYLTIFVLLLSACSPSEQVGHNTKPVSDFQWQLPEGFPLPIVPADNPMSVAKVTLGRKLFYDQNLSFNQQQSCASCHQQQHAFAESTQVSTGTSGEQGKRNAPALVNIAYNKTLTWAHDGLTSIEHQLLLPMFGEDPIELGITNHETQVLARFTTAEYQALFAQAFPGEIVNFDLIVKALSSFVRSLLSFNSDFDRYAYQQDDTALSEAALRGMKLFFSERLECHHCHGGFNFTQSTFHQQQLLDRRPFHNTGLYNVDGSYPNKDAGLAEVSLKPEDNGRFRAPTLRNIAQTAPYMHDGSIATLAEVLDFYAAGGRNVTEGKYQGDGRKNPNKSPFIKGFELTVQDKQDLLAFLASLSDERFLTNTAFANPEIEQF